MILRRLSLWGPPLAYATLIFFVSNDPRPPELPTNDKLVHFAAYVVLGGLLVRAIRGSFAWPGIHLFTSASLLSSLYGLSDELHQSFVPGRFATVGDAVADALGSLLGSALAVAVYALFVRRTESSEWPGLRPPC